MNVNDIYIDGVKYTPFVKGLDGIKVTYSKTDNFIGYGISSELEFMKDAADLIYETFFEDACTGKDALLDVTVIINECCGADEPIELTFVIDFEGVTLCRWNNECLAKVELKTYGECQKGYEYLRDTVFWNDGFAEDGTHYKVHYCRQPKDFLLWNAIFSALFPVLIVLQIVENILTALAKGLVNLLALFGLLPPNIKELFNTLIDQNFQIPSFDNAITFLTGCGNFHFADRLIEILEYNVTKAGAAGGCTMTLDAPILDGTEYEDTSFIWSNSKRGIDCSKKDNPFIDKYKERAGNYTVMQLLNDWREVVNHEAIILPDGSLKIDTYENLVNNAPVIINVENDFEVYGIDAPPCYEFKKAEYCTTSQYEYSQDAYDQEGNKRLRAIKLNELPAVPSYSDVVKWDSDGNSSQTNTCKKVFKFGAVRAMFDMETTNAEDSSFDQDKNIDEMRTGNFNGLDFPALFAFFTEGTCLPQEHALILAEHQSELPKCVVLDTTEPNESFIKHTDFGDLKIYNRPYHLYYESLAPELIKNFHEQTDNPSSEDFRLLELLPYTTKMTASRLATILSNGSYVGIRTRYGVGLPQELTLDFSNCTILINGVSLKCSQPIP